MLKYESDIDFATDTTPAWNPETYTPIQTIAAANTYVNDQDVNPVANNISFSFNKASKGMGETVLFC